MGYVAFAVSVTHIYDEVLQMIEIIVNAESGSFHLEDISYG